MSWGEYRQADFLKENLKYKMDWIVKAYRYKKFIEIENKAELEFFKQRPLIFSIVYLINLPTNIVYLINRFRWNYQYEKICIEARYLRKEINKIDNKTKLLN
jgi:hypothetical protein|tara:strand:- start:5429 stop:5734 length:306 start_codon:yes stop_codon:yes gene_type:complete